MKQKFKDKFLNEYSKDLIYVLDAYSDIEKMIAKIYQVYFPSNTSNYLISDMIGQVNTKDKTIFTQDFKLLFSNISDIRNKLVHTFTIQRENFFENYMKEKEENFQINFSLDRNKLHENFLLLLDQIENLYNILLIKYEHIMLTK